MDHGMKSKAGHVKQLAPLQLPVFSNRGWKSFENESSVTTSLLRKLHSQQQMRLIRARSAFAHLCVAASASFKHYNSLQEQHL